MDDISSSRLKLTRVRVKKPLTTMKTYLVYGNNMRLPLGEVTALIASSAFDIAYEIYGEKSNLVKSQFCLKVK